MKNYVVVLCAFVVLLAVGLINTRLAFAAESDPSTRCTKLEQEAQNFADGEEVPGVLTTNCYSAGGVVNKALQIGFMLAATVAVLMIVWGGAQYTSSAGSEEKATNARKIILWAVIGLIVIIMAWTIVFTQTKILGF